MLYQSLSFSFARTVQDDSDIVSSASCAIFEEADIVSSVSSAREDEQEPKEELSKDFGKMTYCASQLPSLATSLLVPFHLPMLTCACFVQVPMLLLSSAPPAPSTPRRSSPDTIQVRLSACSSCNQHFLFLVQVLNFFPECKAFQFSNAPSISPYWRLRSLSLLVS